MHIIPGGKENGGCPVYIVLNPNGGGGESCLTLTTWRGAIIKVEIMHQLQWPCDNARTAPETTVNHHQLFYYHSLSQTTV